jgi:RimJ/RimL family protein N-acetyltransferase
MPTTRAFLEPVTLRGAHAVLEPLSASHAPALTEAVRDGELWKLWYTFVPSPETMSAEIQRRLDLQAAGSMLPFVVVEPATGKCVGMTTFMNVDAMHRRVEVGSTWYSKRMQRTPVNTQCKLLLLGHAFDALGCIAVELRTSSFNHQSRRAIERIGAKLDGILRNHQLHSNGTLRDTCVYSIVASEWPTVRAHLTFQLARHGS